MPGYVGWKLPESERNRLLEVIPAAYSNIIAHHVTLKFGVDKTHPLPKANLAFVAGVADDGMGVQALIIEIAGTVYRYDDSKYHITWSLGPGRKPVESNDVVKLWPIDIIQHNPHLADKQSIFHDPIPIRLEPKFFPF